MFSVHKAKISITHQNNIEQLMKHDNVLRSIQPAAAQFLQRILANNPRLRCIHSYINLFLVFCSEFQVFVKLGSNSYTRRTQYLSVSMGEFMNLINCRYERISVEDEFAPRYSALLFLSPAFIVYAKQQTQRMIKRDQR